MWARSDEGTQVWTAEQIHDRAGIQAGERKGKIKGLVPLALSGFNAKLRSILTSCRGVGVNLIGKLYSFNGSLEKLWGGGGFQFPLQKWFLFCENSWTNFVLSWWNSLEGHYGEFLTGPHSLCKLNFFRAIFPCMIYFFGGRSQKDERSKGILLTEFNWQ